jgi:hypothetical protein
MHIEYWWKIQKERDHWEDQGVGEWLILKLISETLDLAQNRDQWQVLRNTSMNLRVPLSAGKNLNSGLTDGFSRRAQLYELS